MLVAAGRREFDVLLIDDLSPLARDSLEQEKTIRRLEFHAIRLVAVSAVTTARARPARFIAA
jgi:hypothetical protein